MEVHQNMMLLAINDGKKETSLPVGQSTILQGDAASLIPIDILLRIFEFLDIMKCAAVCKAWRQAAFSAKVISLGSGSVPRALSMPAEASGPRIGSIRWFESLVARFTQLQELVFLRGAWEAVLQVKHPRAPTLALRPPHGWADGGMDPPEAFPPPTPGGALPWMANGGGAAAGTTRLVPPSPATSAPILGGAPFQALPGGLGDAVGMATRSVVRAIRRSCPHLVALWLHGSGQLSDEAVARLCAAYAGRLRTLSLVDCHEITDRAFASFPCLSLAHLSVRGCHRLTPRAVAAVVERCPYLAVLDVSETCAASEELLALLATSQNAGRARALAQTSVAGDSSHGTAAISASSSPFSTSASSTSSSSSSVTTSSSSAAPPSYVAMSAPPSSPPLLSSAHAGLTGHRARPVGPQSTLGLALTQLDLSHAVFQGAETPPPSAAWMGAAQPVVAPNGPPAATHQPRPLQVWGRQRPFHRSSPAYENAFSDACAEMLAAEGYPLVGLGLGGAAISDQGLAALLRRPGSTLVRLGLEHCVGLTVVSLETIGTSLPHLESLDLAHCSLGIAEEGLSMAAYQRLLHAVGTLSQGCPGLQRLSLRGCTWVIPASASDDGTVTPSLDVLDRLLQGFTRLQAIDLSRCTLPPAALDMLATAPCHHKLEALWVGEAEVAPSSFEAISQGCPSLEELDASHTGITDRDLRLLAAHCKRLAHLGLENCQEITDEGIGWLANLPALVDLNLAGVKLGGDALMVLATKAPALQALDIRHFPVMLADSARAQSLSTDLAVQALALLRHRCQVLEPVSNDMFRLPQSRVVQPILNRSSPSPPIPLRMAMPIISVPSALYQASYRVTALPTGALSPWPVKGSGGVFA